jgi:hypothetical protein
MENGGTKVGKVEKRRGDTTHRCNLASCPPAERRRLLESGMLREAIMLGTLRETKGVRACQLTDDMRGFCGEEGLRASHEKRVVGSQVALASKKHFNFIRNEWVVAHELRDMQGSGIKMMDWLENVAEEVARGYIISKQKIATTVR